MHNIFKKYLILTLAVLMIGGFSAYADTTVMVGVQDQTKPVFQLIWKSWLSFH